MILANSVGRMRVCEAQAYILKKSLERQKIEFSGDEATRWWQEPSMVIGGVVVGFSFGSLLTWAAIKR